MLLDPTSLDIAIVAWLARFLGQYPLFDLGVRSAIEHNVLGGFWYGAALFIFWVYGIELHGQESRHRILTTFLGSAVAIGLTLLAGEMVSWLPPCRHPLLAGLYANYFEPNPNTNSFPSQATALYSSIAAGVFSLYRVLGSVLWVGIPLVVALPRIYVGGHYPSDVVVGFVLGLAGYLTARHFLEPRLVPSLARGFEGRGWNRFLSNLVVFVWILQVSVEFRDVVWLRNAVFKYLV